jgi:hypothetical protein
MYDPSGRKSPALVTVMSLLRRMSTCVTWTSRLIRVTPGKFRSITNSLCLVNTRAYWIRARSSRACSASALSPPDGPVTTASMPRVEASVTGRSRNCGNGLESSPVPTEPNSARFAGVSGIRVTDPSTEHSCRSPTATAR